MFRHQSFYITILILAFAFSGCKNNRNDSYIPNVTINEFVYLNNPSSFNLQVQGGWVYNTGGYRGLVVYRRYFNFSYDDFITYDLACPDHFNDSCGKLEVVNDIYLECPCTGHQYLLFDGLPISDSDQILKFYSTQFDGNNTIQIVN